MGPSSVVDRDAALRDPLPLSTLQRDLGLDAEARLLVLGDAYMSPYELMSVGGAIVCVVCARGCG